MIWRCPNCQLPLIASERSLECTNGHSFDRARQGYTNLLLANQKSSREPGDNAEMISARQSFLRSGSYSALVEGVVDGALGAFGIPINDDSLNILDLGCGEGYYLEAFSDSAVAKGYSRFACYGVDVSKIAVRKASTSARMACASQHQLGQIAFDYAVASTFHLPVLDNSVDIAFNIFAPMSVTETVRVLKPKGVLVRVQPGPRHLYQFKGELYDQVLLHTLTEIEPEFFLLRRERVQFNLHLDSPQAIANLLSMTPLCYNGKREAKDALLSLECFDVEVDFDVQVMRSANVDGQ